MLACLCIVLLHLFAAVRVHTFIRSLVLVPLSAVMHFPSLSFVLLILLDPPALAAFIGRCKPVPGDAGWPSDSDWSSLNTTVGGKLIAGVPPASACFPGGKPVSPADSATCASVASNWGTSSWHSNDPVSADWANLQKDACLPTDLYNKPDATCDFSQFPKYVIDAHGPEDVQAGVKFAAKTGVRLIVKATGHDFLGRSTAPGALSIWTHNIRGASYSASFQPEKCDRSSLAGKKALTYSAGEQMSNVYAFAKSNAVTLVAGADPNVGIAGWMLGGGHSTISATYGLGVDNVIEMKVVKPSGDYVTANECQNSDLFWAFRGVSVSKWPLYEIRTLGLIRSLQGGGATFGVMISVTVVAYDEKPFALASLSFNSTVGEANNNNNTKFFELLEFVYQYFPNLSDASFGGYTVGGKIEPGGSANPFSAPLPENSVPTLDWINDPTPKQMFFYMVGGVVGKAAEDIAPLFQPLIDKFNTYNGSLEGMASFQSLPSFTAYRETIPPGGVGVNTLLGSRLWDKGALTNPGLKPTLRTMFNPGLQALIVSGPAVRKNSAFAVSANPAWRQTYSHMIAPMAFAFKDTAGQKAASDYIANTFLPTLTRRAPGTGAYINEAFPDQPNWQATFWGANYPRLFAIKKIVDPLGLFWCKVCVGSEDWHEDGTGRICRG